MNSKFIRPTSTPTNTPNRARGFTLLELMVAIVIFAILGIMSAQLLNNMIRQHDIIDERGKKLMDLQRAMTIMQRDLSQVITRRVRDEYGDELGSFVTGGVFPVEFTRTGWRNPLEHPRSELQRVAYEHREKTLYRYYWPVLDRAIDTEPVEQKLMENVLSVEFEPLDGYGDDYMPQNATGNSGDKQLQLAAISVRFDLEGYGEVNRLWELPSSLDVNPGAKPGAGGLTEQENGSNGENTNGANNTGPGSPTNSQSGNQSGDVSANPQDGDGDGR